MRCSMRSKMYKNLIPLSRPIFDWGCIRDAWSLCATSDRELCRLLGIDRKRLRQRIARENWTRRKRERIKTLHVIANWSYARGGLHAGGRLEEDAKKREMELEILVLRASEMIAAARDRVGRNWRRECKK
jgi:hypothetical protein